MQRVGCLFLPYFLAAVTAEQNPQWRKQAIAVFREDRVVGVSPELKDQSLLGLSLTRARGRCPEALFVEYEHSVHQAAQERYLKVLTGVSPLIEPLDEQECFLDASGSRTESELKGLGKWFAARGWGPVVMGLGGNKLLARLATRVPFKKGQAEIPNFYPRTVEPGQEEDFLRRVPLELDWLLPPRTLKSLTSLGFTRFGELRSLSRQDLLKMLGRDGYLVWRHSQGLDGTPLMGLYPPEKISCYFDFTPGLHHREPLERALEKGAREIVSTLRKRGMNCRQVALEFELEEGICRGERRIGRGCGEESRLGEILGILLKELSLAGPVLGMMLEVSALYKWSLAEQDLFSLDQKSTRPYQDLKRALEALEGKIPGAVYTGLTIDRREQVLNLWDPWRF